MQHNIQRDHGLGVSVDRNPAAQSEPDAGRTEQAGACVTLWRAVLIQAVRDLNIAPRGKTPPTGAQRLARAEAKAFFDDSERVLEIADRAGVDGENIVRTYQAGALEGYDDMRSAMKRR